MYRAALARMLYTTEWEDDDPMRDCIKQALAVRTRDGAQDWFDRWPRMEE